VSARRREEKGRPGKARDASPARKAPRCPICGKPTVAEYRPFCSRRCANIDLGRWLGGRYAVPGEPVGADAAGDLWSEDDEDAGC
jgi:endogenous inhibitor of DNA gyrase (YacG/DUF329 family)